VALKLLVAESVVDSLFRIEVGSAVYFDNKAMGGAIEVDDVAM
jgi:hypothetical protein